MHRYQPVRFWHPSLQQVTAADIRSARAKEEIEIKKKSEER